VSARLVAPSPRYAAPYVAALREGFSFATQPSALPQPIEDIEAEFAGYIARMTDQAGTVTLPTGEVVSKVPFSVFCWSRTRRSSASSTSGTS
jgi:hypothetical protein